MLSSLRFQSEINLWDPKATRDPGEISDVHGNLFAAVAIYATDADAWAILIQGFLEGRRKEIEWWRSINLTFKPVIPLIKPLGFLSLNLRSSTRGVKGLIIYSRIGIRSTGSS